MSEMKLVDTCYGMTGGDLYICPACSARSIVRAGGAPPSHKCHAGLYNKYRVTKADGSPVDERARYFVLRYDEANDWGEVCRAALETIASRLRGGTLDSLAQDLEHEIRVFTP